MRLKDLFTVPTGEKVTERHLNRVLVSSICGLLLCMACLVGTTWAWFTDSVIRLISEQKEHVVFILWGGNARSKRLRTHPVRAGVA